MTVTTASFRAISRRANLGHANLGRRVAVPLLLLLTAALAACSVGDAGPRGQQTPIAAGTSAAAAPVTVVPLDQASGTPGQVSGAGEAVKVALLVPTSGAQSALGQALQDAAQLAVFEVADKSFTLTTYDTGDSASGAAAAARKATGEGAKLLLGPVFGPATRAVAPAAGGVGVVSFSNDPSVAGGGVYLLGFQPRDQVARVVGYAASKGMKRIALLAPGNDYGRLVAEALAGAATRHGVTVPQSRLYNPRGTDVDAEARALAQAGDFDAVLVPEGGARLRQIAQTLKSVKLLGTGQWDDAATTSIPGLAGAWFATSAPEQYAEFVKRYQRTYGKPPPRLATVAYDATALAAVLGRGGDFGPSALASPNGFAGIDGIFRFGPDGVSERGLAVYEITEGGRRVVDPAPTSFQGLTN